MSNQLLTVLLLSFFTFVTPVLSKELSKVSEYKTPSDYDVANESFILRKYKKAKAIARELSLIPEYKKTNAIVIAIDNSFFLDNPQALEKRKATQLLARENPSMQFVIIGTDEVSEQAKKYFSNKSNILYVNSKEDKVYPWARDWVPRMLSSGHLLNLYGGVVEESSLLESLICNSMYEKPELHIGNEVMMELNGTLSLISDAILKSDNMNDIEGGDLIVGKNRQCFTAGSKDDYVSKQLPGCSELHVLPELPGESTGHIDIFAQFVNEHTVMVANYKNNKMQKTLFQLPENFWIVGT
jgi:hypothetical protein